MDEENKAKQTALGKVLDWIGLGKTAKDIKHECAECAKAEGGKCSKCREKEQLRKELGE